jgi:hypothetical protein
LVAVWGKVDAALTDVAGNPTVALSNFIIAKLSTLLNLHLLSFDLLFLFGQARFLQDTGSTGASLAEVSNVTLEIHLSAGARLDARDLFVFLSVVAEGALLPAHKGLVHAEEAFVLTKTAIVRCPELVVGCRISCNVSALALGFVELGEIDVHEEGLVALLDEDLLFLIIFFHLLFSLHGVGSVDHELL